MKNRIRQSIYRYRRKRAERKVTADPHTLEQVAAYAIRKYNATETDRTKRKYIEQCASAKEGLVIRYRPELLQGLEEPARPDGWDEASAEEFFRQIRLRSQRIADIPDQEMPMDFHVYEINIPDGWMELTIDFKWDIFSLSFSGNRKTMKELKKISQDLHVYYGVSEDDIQRKTKRYSSLVTSLSGV